MILEVNGFKVNVVRSKRAKRMLLRVLPPYGEIRLTLPERKTLDEAKRFVLSLNDWIVRKRIEVTRKESEVSYLDGGKALKLLGKRYLIEEIVAERFSLDFSNQIAYFSAPKQAMREQKIAFVKSYMLGLAKAELLPRVERWEEIIGVKSSGLTFRFMTSRWGSCNTRTKKITFNVLAVQNEPRYLDYLVCHELLHVIYPNHGTAFKAHLKQLIPDCARYDRLPIR